MPAATFSAVALVLLAAHLLADYVIQTDHLAAAKATPGYGHYDGTSVWISGTGYAVSRRRD